MNTIKARGKEHIRSLIKDAMKKHGNECDLNHIDVSETTSLNGVFSPQYENNCSAFNGDISRWNTSNVTDMSSMFYDSKFQGDISNWDVSRVTTMNGMFSKSVFNGDISRWNTSSVSSMSSMFSDSQFDGDISRWNTSKVLNMAGMFTGSVFNGDLSTWDVSKVVNMKQMFEKSKFSGDLSQWDISNALILHGMFFGSAFHGDLSTWRLNPRVQATVMIKNIDNYEAFDSFHDSPLGYLGVLKGKYSFPSDDAQAVAFQEARAVCDALSLDIIAAAQHLYQHVHGRSLPEDASLSFDQLFNS